MLKKQFIASEIKADDEDRTITAVISTSGVDRDREVVVAKGGDFTNYLKNPVVLFAHNYQELPIAKTLWIKQTGSKITAKAKFADVGMADDVYKLYKGGFLKAFSIGFIPNKRHQPSPKEIEKRPELANVWNIIDEWELLEFSAVPVPSNPEALTQAVKSKAISLTTEMLKEFELDDDEEKTFLADEKATYDSEGNEEVSTLGGTALLKDFETPVIVVTPEPIKVDAIIKVTPIENFKVSPLMNVTEIFEEKQKKHKGIVYD